MRNYPYVGLPTGKPTIGNEEVGGSTPLVSSIKKNGSLSRFFGALYLYILSIYTVLII
jgi:hypothetical protein